MAFYYINRKLTNTGYKLCDFCNSKNKNRKIEHAFFQEQIRKWHSNQNNGKNIVKILKKNLWKLYLFMVSFTGGSAQQNYCQQLNLHSSAIVINLSVYPRQDFYDIPCSSLILR